MIDEQEAKQRPGNETKGRRHGGAASESFQSEIDAESQNSGDQRDREDLDHQKGKGLFNVSRNRGRQLRTRPQQMLQLIPLGQECGAFPGRHRIAVAEID